MRACGVMAGAILATAYLVWPGHANCPPGNGQRIWRDRCVAEENATASPRGLRGFHAHLISVGSVVHLASDGVLILDARRDEWVYDLRWIIKPCEPSTQIVGINRGRNVIRHDVARESAYPQNVRRAHATYLSPINATCWWPGLSLDTKVGINCGVLARVLNQEPERESDAVCVLRKSGHKGRINGEGKPRTLLGFHFIKLPLHDLLLSSHGNQLAARESGDVIGQNGDGHSGSRGYEPIVRIQPANDSSDRRTNKFLEYVTGTLFVAGGYFLLVWGMGLAMSFRPMILGLAIAALAVLVIGHGFGILIG